MGGFRVEGVHILEVYVSHILILPSTAALPGKCSSFDGSL